MSKYAGLCGKKCYFDSQVQYTIFSIHLLQPKQVATVPMVMFVWWEASISMRVEWRCASMTSGEQCVMTTGTALMPLSSASSWDMHTLAVSVLFNMSPNLSIFTFCMYLVFF